MSGEEEKPSEGWVPGRAEKVKRRTSNIPINGESFTQREREQ